MVCNNFYPKKYVIINSQNILFLQLITALKDQQRLSESLRDYIDMLTARVLEVNPTLLEVNSGNSRKR